MGLRLSMTPGFAFGRSSASSWECYSIAIGADTSLSLASGELADSLPMAISSGTSRASHGR